MYSVRHMELKTSFLNVARARNDEYGRDIIQCIEPVNDLIETDAQYQASVLNMFMEQKKQSSFAEEIDRAIQRIDEKIMM